jgi:hypothetical protein
MSVEDRVREALREHAEDFTARPDAWQQLRARRDASGRRRAVRRRSWPARVIGPAAAAAAVVVIVLAAAAVSGTFDRAGTGPGAAVRATPSGTGTASPRPTASSSFAFSADGPAGQLLAMDPPVSSVIGLRVPWTGSGRKADQVTSYFWLGFASPHYWLDQVVSGPQFCNDTVNLTNGESGGFCWPLPPLGTGQQARVTGDENAGTNQVILVGAAAAAVTSVAAALPDGRTFTGVVKAGHGLRDKAWTVGYPPSAGVRLIFRNAAGTQVAVLGTARPDGPPQTTWPGRGGVTAFSYPASYREPKGQVEAYLIQGRVGFLGMWGGQISPLSAAGPAVLGGLTDPFDSLRGGQWGRLEALGYAHANVARVVLTLPGGKTVSTSTFPARWPGSSLRLWAVKVPENAASIDRPRSDITATAYDAAGHVLGRVQLGIMQ